MSAEDLLSVVLFAVGNSVNTTDGHSCLKAGLTSQLHSSLCIIEFLESYKTHDGQYLSQLDRC